MKFRTNNALIHRQGFNDRIGDGLLFEIWDVIIGIL